MTVFQTRGPEPAYIMLFPHCHFLELQQWAGEATSSSSSSCSSIFVVLRVFVLFIVLLLLLLLVFLLLSLGSVLGHCCGTCKYRSPQPYLKDGWLGNPRNIRSPAWPQAKLPPALHRALPCCSSAWDLASLSGMPTGRLPMNEGLFSLGGGD